MALLSLAVLVPHHAWAYSNNPSAITGLTSRDGGAGCTSCHGSPDATISVVISGPTALNAGQSATYTATATKSGLANGNRMGLALAAGDTGTPLAVFSGEPMSAVGSRELIHNAGVGALKTSSSGTASYQFTYTMPGGAAAGSTHVLYATSRFQTTTWNHAANFTVTTRPSAPSTLTPSNLGIVSVDYSWTGGGPEYRLVYKAGAVAPSSEVDGTIAFTGSGTSTSVTGLAAGTQYTFRVFSKLSGSSVYSTSGPSSTITTNAGFDMPSTDFNDDLKSDILWRNFSTGGIFRMLMNGFSVTNGALIYTEQNTAWRVVADADFNGDGVSDLLWRNTSTGQVYMMLITSTGLVGNGAIIYTEPNAAWKIVHTPDLNGDGSADLLWWNSTSGQVYAMLMNGFSITNQGAVYQEPNTSWQIAGVGDFSNTGKQNQLLWRNISTGQVYMMTVTNTGNTFSQSGVMIYTSQLLYKIVGIADFNGDGHSDVLWRHDNTGAVYIFLMNGSSISFEGQIYQEPNTNWRIVAVGDYNGNGKADILWRNYATGQVFMMLMNGASIASASLMYTEGNLNWRILGPYEYGQ